MAKLDKNEKTPIVKSAKALLKIHQLIEVGYDGNVTNEEWLSSSYKYILVPIYKNGKVLFNIIRTNYFSDKCFVAFHTEKQAEEFLSKSENVQLLKGYIMLENI